MKCSSSGCSHNADKRCAECLQYFCSAHVEICDFCEMPVCHDCREVHQANPLHDEGKESA